MLFHGIHKVTHGPGGVIKMFEAQNWPGFLAYGLYLGELAAPLLILIGFFSRPAGGLIALTMLVAVYTAFRGQIFSVNSATGAWAIEINAFYFLTGLAIACLGSGRYSVSKGRAPWD